MTSLITTDLTPVPSRQRPTTYSDEADAFDAKLPAWTDEANALAVGANNNATWAALSASIADSLVTTSTELLEATVDSNNATVSVTNASKVSAVEASNNASSFASETAADRDYVAEQSAFVASIYGLVGIGIDSEGNLSASINSESNIESMELNSDGELIVTYK